jgi:hypothetical protein
MYPTATVHRPVRTGKLSRRSPNGWNDAQIAMTMYNEPARVRS